MAFEVDEKKHRTPYEELQSINEDGFIVAMKYSTNYNSIIGTDYALGRFHDVEHIRADKTYLVKNMALKFPQDAQIGLYQPFGYLLSRYLIDKPNATWRDVYDYLRQAIKDMSYWVEDDGSEGYLILIQSPVDAFAEMETFPTEADSRLYVFDKLGWRHPVMIRWTEDDLLTMKTRNNSHRFSQRIWVHYYIGAEYYEYDGVEDRTIHREPFETEEEYLNLLTMMKPVPLGIVNMSHVGNKMKSELLEMVGDWQSWIGREG